MHAKRGFTLIELMIVVVVIGIIAALAVPRYLDYGRTSREAEAMPLLKQVYTLEQRHHARFASYTDDITQLEGGPDIAVGGRYFTLSVAAHASGFCAVATPNAEGTDAGLNPQSLDGTGDFHASDNCT